MAQLAFGIGGAVAGSFVGQPQLGFAGGVLLGSLFNKQDDIVNEGPKINSLPTTTSAFGVTRAIVFGTLPVSGNIIDKSKVRNVRHEEKQESGGKGLGGGSDVTNVYYTAEVDLDIASGEGPIGGYIKVYANATLLIDNTPGSNVTSPPWLRYKIYFGTEDQEPDPTFEALRGSGNVPAYRGTPHVVFTNFQLEQFGNQIPTFRLFQSSIIDSSSSVETKESGGSSAVGGVLINQANSLAYHFNLTGNQICQLYDIYSRSVVTLMYAPTGLGVVGLDENGGAGLFSLPLVVNGEIIPVGPNRHFWVNSEIDDEHKLLVYDSLTGEFLGAANLGVGNWENFRGVIADEKAGVVFRVTVDFSSFYSNLRGWRLVYNVDSLTGPIAVFAYQEVLIPVADRDGVGEWTWLEDPSYPEGTSRNGLLAFIANDEVTLETYLCYIDYSDPSVVSKLIQITDGFQIGGSHRTINKIIYDDVQNLFWLIGADENDTNHTRWRAYDEDGNIFYDVVDTSGGWYDSVARLGTFSNSTASIVFTTLTNSQARSFNVITHENVQLTDAFPISDGPYDNIVYHHGTGSIIKTRGGFRLDFLSISNQTSQSVLLSSVFNDICDRAGLQPSQYLTSELDPRTLDGYGVLVDGNFRSKMLALQQAYLVDAIDEGDRIRFRYRGQSAAATITEDELAVVEDQGNSQRTNIIIRKEMELKLPGRTEVTYYNEKAEYEQNTQVARREASYVQDNSTRVVLDVVLDDNTGIRLADTIEHLSHIEGEVYEITTFPKYLYLTVGDIINIVPSENESYIGRIIQKTFLGSYVKFVCTREESSVLTSFLEGGEVEPRVVTVPINPLTFFTPLDIPLLLESDNNAGYYLSGGGIDNSWTGGNIYRSEDLQSWSLLGTLLNFSNMGSTSNILLNKSSTSWDRESSLLVTVRAETELSSCTEEEALQGVVNAVAIGKPNGGWEICNFVNAVLVGDNQYQVDTFLRGRIGTEWMIDKHTPGDQFVLLSRDDLIYISDTLASIGIQVTLRSVSFGQNLYADQVLDQGFINNGICLKTLAPAQLRANIDPNTLDIKFTWQPRTRFPLNNFWSAETSDLEDYHFVISKLDETILKDISGLSIGEYVYTRLDQLADGLPADTQELISCNAYHISQVLTVDQGRGYPANIVVPAGPSPHPYVVYSESIGMTYLWEMADDGVGETISEYLGRYVGGSTAAIFQQASLFDSYKQSIEFGQTSGLGRGLHGDIDVADFNFEKWSLAVMIQVQEANSRGIQHLVSPYADSGTSESDFVRITWRADGNLEFDHRNGLGENNTIVTSIPLVVGTTAHIVLTFESTGPMDFGTFTAYINGVSVGSVSSRSENSTAVLVKCAFGFNSETVAIRCNVHRTQMFSWFVDKVLSSEEVSNMYGLTNL